MKKKVGALVFVGVAILTVGVVAALWVGTIQAESTVRMARMTLVFDDFDPPICTEFHEGNPDGPLLLGDLYGVGATTIQFQGEITDPDTQKRGYENMIITISNAYPGYMVNCTFTLCNIGAIPIDIQEIYVTDPSGALTWKDTQGALVDGDSSPIIHMEHTGLVGERIISGDTMKSEIGIRIGQDAREGEIYYFEMEIVYMQSEY